MKLLVVGASKGLGSYVVKEALRRDHQVTAFARTPERLGLTDPKLRLAKGDVLDTKSVDEAVAEVDAILITLGLPTKRAMGFGKSRVVAEGTRNVIQAAERANVKKLVTETAIGTSESVRDIGPFAKLGYRVVLGWLFRQKDEQEALTKTSSLDWTIIRPTALTNGPKTGHYLTESGLKVDMFTHVSRADVAEAMIRAAEGEFSRQALTVSYPRNRLTDTVGWARHYF